MTQQTADTPVLAVPTDWMDSYSEQNRQDVASIHHQLAELGLTRAWLARLSRVAPTTQSQVLNGKYPTDPSKWIRQMTDALATHTNRKSVGVMPHVVTSTYQMAVVVCDRARQYRNFGVLCGYVGVGKTEAIKQYQQRNTHTLLIEANPDMSPSVMLDELRAQLAAPMSRSLDAKFSSIVEALTNTTFLLIVDEAETMRPKCLHYLRRIRDKAGVGIVLVGTERLLQLVKPSYGEFDQIRSRVGFWPQMIKGITREDADALAQAALSDQGELPEDALDALWHYCKGSARMLVENFIPALRDYGLKKHAMSADLVHAVARDVLLLGESRPY